MRNKQTGEQIQTTDPGRALITGKWKDIGRFKGPILRALATRAPYFHNGSASDLDAVVDFYNQRFGIGLTDAEKDDLVAFLLTRSSFCGRVGSDLTAFPSSNDRAACSALKPTPGFKPPSGRAASTTPVTLSARLSQRCRSANADR